MNRALRTVLAIGVVVAAAVLSGCAGSGRKRAAAQDERSVAALAEARQLYHERRYTEAMLRCSDMARRDPFAPGLPELRKQIMDGMTAYRSHEADLRTSATLPRMAVDAEQQKTIPETYGLKLPVVGTNRLDLMPVAPIEKVLGAPLSLFFTNNLTVGSLISEIKSAANINMIIDPALAENDVWNKEVPIHAEKVPLSEIFDALRSLGVAFYAGQNMIWVTQQTSKQPVVPLETRIYRLTKGLANITLDAQGVEDDSNILKAINTFVPPAADTGAAILLDKSTHVLIVKDTRERLKQIEQIIQTLDVTPPQVLIEARFISTSLNDLRELGVDLKNVDEIPVTRTRVLQNGQIVSLPKTAVAAGSPMLFNDFTSKEQGLNLTYQGILTKPRFEAVLHALDKTSKTKTLSVPRVTTMNNCMAMIRVGETFKYWSQLQQQQQQVFDPRQNVWVYNVTYVPTGLTDQPLGITLEVTPTVGADMKAISLRLKPQIQDFVRWETPPVSGTGGGTGTGTSAIQVLPVPIFREQTMNTKITVQSGETVVLGGLITTTESDSKDSIPFLGRIPLIGHLFRHDNTNNDNKNLLVFVTATIVSQRGESLIPVN